MFEFFFKFLSSHISLVFNYVNGEATCFYYYFLDCFRHILVYVLSLIPLHHHADVMFLQGSDVIIKMAMLLLATHKVPVVHVVSRHKKIVISV